MIKNGYPRVCVSTVGAKDTGGSKNEGMGGGSISVSVSVSVRECKFEGV